MIKIVHFLLSKIIPALTLVIFIIIMNAGTVCRDFFGLNGEVAKHFTLLQLSINNQQWSTAQLYLDDLENEWKKLLARLQFSVERDEINTFQHSLARMKGFIEAQDNSGCLGELRELEETWSDLGK